MENPFIGSLIAFNTFIYWPQSSSKDFDVLVSGGKLKLSSNLGKATSFLAGNALQWLDNFSSSRYSSFNLDSISSKLLLRFGTPFTVSFEVKFKIIWHGLSSKDYHNLDE